jgi:hypothetical protein
VGTLKGVGRIYQQTFIDTYSKAGVAKLYDRKTPVTAADLLNDRVLSLFEQHEIPLNRVLTDRGTEYCGAAERHELLCPPHSILVRTQFKCIRIDAFNIERNHVCSIFNQPLNRRIVFRSGAIQFSAYCTVLSWLPWLRGKQHFDLNEIAGDWFTRKILAAVALE